MLRFVGFEVFAEVRVAHFAALESPEEEFQMLKFRTWFRKLSPLLGFR